MLDELKVGWNECERGNTFLTNSDDGKFKLIAWFTICGNARLEIDYVSSNYPALHARIVEVTDAELVSHINTMLGGWTIEKVNLDGVRFGDDGRVCCPEDEETDESEMIDALEVANLKLALRVHSGQLAASALTSEQKETVSRVLRDLREEDHG